MWIWFYSPLSCSLTLTLAVKVKEKHESSEFISWHFLRPNPTAHSPPTALFFKILDFRFLQLIPAAAASLSFQSHCTSACLCFSSRVHLWEYTERFGCPGSLCQYTVRHLTTRGDWSNSHRPTRLSACSFRPSLWFCGSLLMSPCQSLFFWMPICKHLSTVIACVLLRLSITNNVTIWKSDKCSLPRKLLFL